MFSGVHSISKSYGSKNKVSSNENTIKPSVVTAAHERPVGEKEIPLTL